MSSPPSKRRSTNGSTVSTKDLPDVATDPSPLSALFSTTEHLIVLIYPLTLVLAGAFYLLSPSPAVNSSYFSKKSNIPNILFVKFGWAWTSAVFLLHLRRVRSSHSKALLRWGLATVWWILITQWCFGPPVMDRTFLVTGGTCKMLSVGAIPEGMSAPRRVFTGAACKVAGGNWSGGHDLSGHVFLLTHASLFLWSEVLPFLRAGIWGGIENTTVYALLGLWVWMLLMTGEIGRAHV